MIGVALLFAVAAFGWWAWQTSDSQENARETEALTAALSGQPYEEADPNLAGSYVLGAIGAVLFISGVVLVAVSPRRDEPDA